jgi:hypothetical protein
LVPGFAGLVVILRPRDLDAFVEFAGDGIDVTID